MTEIRPFSTENFEQKLGNFLSYISKITFRETEFSTDERRTKIFETLRFDQFYLQIKQIFRTDFEPSSVKRIYKRICYNPDYEVEWSELFGYSLAEKNADGSAGGGGADQDEDDNDDDDKTARNDNDMEEVQIFANSYKFRVGEASGEKARRDILMCIYMALDIDAFFTVAQKGTVCFWNNRLKLQACTYLKEQSDGWLSGCCYLPNIKRVFITAERSLTSWDFRNNKSQNKKQNNTITLLSMVNQMNIMVNMTCIDSIYKWNILKETDKVIIGDSFGHIMTFVLNVNELSSNNIKSDITDRSKAVLFLDPIKNELVKKKIHDEAVTKIRYIPELSSFISCSSSETCSLAIEELEKFEKKDLRIHRQVAINKGLNTFCYCVRANLIATGGVDKVIRLFNPLVVNKTCGKLLGHLFTLVDLVCNEEDQHLISLSSERVFRVWDLATLKCIQVFSDTESRPGEKRIFCLAFDQKRDKLFTCSSVIDCWPLTRSINETAQLPHTHEKPLVSICHSTNQIASVCSESILKAWETDTGKLIYTIKEIHGPSVEVTCMEIDPSGYRLVTGAKNGSIKVWDFGAGQELKYKLNFEYATLTDESDSSTAWNDMRGIIDVYYVKMEEELMIAVLSMDNTIKMYLDSLEINDLILVHTYDHWEHLIRTSKVFSSGLAAKRRSDLKRFNSKLHSMDKIEEESNKSKLKLRLEKKSFSLQREDSLRDGSRKMSLESMNSYTKLSRIKTAVKPVNYPKPSFYFKDKQWFLVGNKQVLIWDLVEKSIKYKIAEFPNDYVMTSSLKKCLDEAHGIEHDKAAAHTLRQVITITVIMNKNKTENKISLEVAEENDDDDQAESVIATETIKPEESPIEKPIEKKTTSDQQQLHHHRHHEKKVDHSHQDKAALETAATDATETNHSPIIVTSHADSSIRFWSLTNALGGELGSSTLLHEIISPMSSLTGSVITSMCSDQFAKYLYMGDSLGYITMFSIRNFCDKVKTNQKINYLTNDANLITMKVCWKAHLNKIVKLNFVHASKILLSASTDESVRVWWGARGRFIGFLGQTKLFLVPNDDTAAWVPPYDISETPIYSNKMNADKSIEKKYDYHLVYDKARMIYPGSSKSVETGYKNFNDERYFEALVKPYRPFNGSTSLKSSMLLNEGSVFSSLPLYQEKTMVAPDLRRFLAQNPYRHKGKEITYLAFERRNAAKNNSKKNEPQPIP